MSLTFLVNLAQFVVDHSNEMTISALVRWTELLQQIASF